MIVALASFITGCACGAADAASAAAATRIRIQRTAHLPLVIIAYSRPSSVLRTATSLPARAARSASIRSGVYS